MGLFQTKPSMVEAEQLSRTPSEADIQKISTWLGADQARTHENFLGVNFLVNGYYITVLHGDWIVKHGDDKFSVVDRDTFAARYSWVGPKQYYDAPYMVN